MCTHSAEHHRMIITLQHRSSRFLLGHAVAVSVYQFLCTFRALGTWELIELQLKEIWYSRSMFELRAIISETEQFCGSVAGRNHHCRAGIKPQTLSRDQLLIPAQTYDQMSAQPILAQISGNNWFSQVVFAASSTTPQIPA